MKIAITAGLSLLAATFAWSPVQAQIELVETCTDTLGATVVTWDCDFADTNYAVGNIVVLTVNWTVEAGAASFDDFVLRKSGFTPNSKKYNVDGLDPVILNVIDNGTGGSVEVSFLYTALHKTGKKGSKGNAHFGLLLFVDEDGDGAVNEKSSQFGVNVHVTAPADDGGLESVRRFKLLGEDEGVQTGSWGAIKARFDN